MAAEPLRKPTYSSLDKGKDQDKTRDQMTEVMLVQKTGNEREEEHFFREKKKSSVECGVEIGGHLQQPIRSHHQEAHSSLVGSPAG